MGKYKIIYADPPWRYRSTGLEGCAENYYQTMSVEEIQSLPVARIADDDCILFLWVTFPCLQEGLSVMKSWGFNYRTCGFVWVKKNKKKDSYYFGLGFWTRTSTEICLIGTKGKPKRVSNKVPQVCDARLWNTVESQMKSVNALKHYVEMFHALNCLQEENMMDGSALEMKLMEKISGKR